MGLDLFTRYNVEYSINVAILTCVRALRPNPMPHVVKSQFPLLFTMRVHREQITCSLSRRPPPSSAVMWCTLFKIGRLLRILLGCWKEISPLKRVVVWPTTAKWVPRWNLTCSCYWSYCKLHELDQYRRLERLQPLGMEDGETKCDYDNVRRCSAWLRESFQRSLGNSWTKSAAMLR